MVTDRRRVRGQVAAGLAAVAAWLAAVAAAGFLDVTGHRFLAFVPVFAVFLVSVAAFFTPEDSPGVPPPVLHRASVLVSVLAGVALLAATATSGAYLTLRGTDTTVTVARVTCEPDQGTGAGCLTNCDITGDDGRDLGTLPCRTGDPQPGDRLAARIDPAGLAAPRLPGDLLPPVLAWAGLPFLAAGAVLLFTAVRTLRA